MSFGSSDASFAKFRIRFLPLFGCTAEENHVQKICFASINETLFHLADVEFRKDHVLDGIGVDVVIGF